MPQGVCRLLVEVIATLRCEYHHARVWLRLLHVSWGLDKETATRGYETRYLVGPTDIFNFLWDRCVLARFYPAAPAAFGAAAGRALMAYVGQCRMNSPSIGDHS